MIYGMKFDLVHSFQVNSPTTKNLPSQSKPPISPIPSTTAAPVEFRHQKHVSA
ncbi:hypothetical protein Hdeb2414_s0012g00397931 [Helianthus debilis subsp. tardiflorus]